MTCPICPGMNPFHQVVDTGLAGRGPLRVMLAHNLRRVTENISDIFKAGAIVEELRRQRVSEPVRMRTRDQRRLEHRRKTPIRNILHCAFRRYAVPEIVTAILLSPTWKRKTVERVFQFAGDRQEHRLSAFSVRRNIRQRPLSRLRRSLFSIATSPMRSAV